MAERRMFAKTIIDSDAFLDMPLSAQALYFHLSMRADDDGFVNNPKKIQRMIGATDDDFKLLIAKSFVLIFESGVIVIKHWRINNYIQKDRYKETVYTEEKDLLKIKDNGSYTLCIHDGYKLDTQVSIGKDSIGNNKRFVPPTVDEVRTYCQEKGYMDRVNPNKFVDFYESKGWMVGKNKMKDWKAAVRNWASKDKDFSAQKVNKFNNFEQRQYDFSDLERMAYEE